MKNIIRNEYLKSKEHLKELVKKTFNEIVENNNNYNTLVRNIYIKSLVTNYNDNY